MPLNAAETVTYWRSVQGKIRENLGKRVVGKERRTTRVERGKSEKINRVFVTIELGEGLQKT